ncbi:single-stranded DNA-binding protein (plasmid) [Agrobacterium sp. rho-13.3]|uniref:single-stranded DNA-binding protein n=1 Tax=Agrobacterium sp. rho-13.3 TaxID=3072980 RepID=UPI002A11A5CF|nr:single-stranded DNA-binding protein [Agrobacterium sp. rho-13.3]MDX8311576.1 single-stranded DNA-binding protein [Agrobacterium sp. rho-13.3]
MQVNLFTGNLAGPPELLGVGEKAVCRFTLIDNEYVGKDANQEPQFRKVAVQFAAFGSDATRIHKHCRTGDQLIVHWQLRNNNYEQEGKPVYSYNFNVREVVFGAPGAEKRAEFERQAAG